MRSLTIYEGFESQKFKKSHIGSLLEKLHNQYCHIEQADLVMHEKNVPILNIWATFPNELDLDEPLDIIEWFWILKPLIPKMTRNGIFKLSETQNPHNLSMISSRIIFWRLWSLFGCSRLKNDDLLNHSEFFISGVRTLLFLTRYEVFDFLRPKTFKNRLWHHAKLYFEGFGSYLVVLGPKLAIYTTILSFLPVYMAPGVSTSLIWPIRDFWLFEAQNPQ